MSEPRALREFEHGLNLGTILAVERIEQRRNRISREARDQIGDILRFEVLDSPKNFILLHIGDEPRPHRIKKF